MFRKDVMRWKRMELQKRIDHMWNLFCSKSREGPAVKSFILEKEACHNLIGEISRSYRNPIIDILFLGIIIVAVIAAFFSIGLVIFGPGWLKG
jgi:hypothetical protein